jgi:hypothetical protein
MGWTPTNKAEIHRVFGEQRKFIVRWYDDYLQKWDQKDFLIDYKTHDRDADKKALEEALTFMSKELSSLAM